MTTLHAIILGLVEGITEYLPVSSTGHLIITSSLLGLDDPGNKSALDAFEIVVQGGAILAVVGLYRERFIQMLRGVLGRDNRGFALLVNLVIAFIPAAVIGKLLKEKIEAHLFHPAPVVAALALGGVYMMVVDQRRRGGLAPPRFEPGLKEVDDLRPHEALMIGLLQCVAMIPGTSRSMMTITGGYFAGLKSRAAAEFSFLLGVPTLTAACLYALYKDATRPRGQVGMVEALGAGPVVIGIVVAAVSAALAVKWLVGFLTRRGLTPFGWYRLVLAAALAGLIVGGIVQVRPRDKAAPAGAEHRTDAGVALGAR